MPMSVQIIKEKYEAELLARPGVVSVGIGQNPDGSPLIIIGTNTNDTKLISVLPKRLDQVPVKIQVIGSVRTQN